jgi:hypothetical protein
MAQRRLNVRELLELERNIYQESIDRVLQQQRKLQGGELEDFVRRCRPFEADRERELQVAQAQHRFSQVDAQSLLAFDLQQAEDVFRTEKKQLKLKLQERVRRRRSRLLKQLKELDEKDSKLLKTKRNLRKHVARDDDIALVKNGAQIDQEQLSKQLRRAQRWTRRIFNFRHLSGGVLPTPERIANDVTEECKRLQRHRERLEAARMAQEEGAAPPIQVTVSEDGGKVVCRGDSGVETFGVGDAVVLASRLTEEDFHGFVSGVSQEEVKLVLVCGTHARVTLDRLRSGQCSLLKRREEVRQDAQEEYQAKIPPPGVAASLEELLRDPPDTRRRAAAVLSTSGSGVSYCQHLTIYCFYRPLKTQNNGRYPARVLTGMPTVLESLHQGFCRTKTAF